MPSCFSWFAWTPDSTGPCTSYWANSPSWTWCWFSLLCPKWLLTIWPTGSLSPPLAVGSRSSSSSLLEGVSATLDSYVLWSQCPCLSSTEIPSPHELEIMPKYDFGVFVPRCSWWARAGCCYPEFLILQCPRDWSFRLWDSHPCAFGLSVTSVFEYVMYMYCVLMLLSPLSLILISYSLILAAVFQICSNETHRKAFDTSSSHVSMVGLFFGAAIFTSMRPKSYRSSNHDKFVSAFYTIFTPVLTPPIYILRNSEIKGDLRKCMNQWTPLSHE